MYPNVMRGHCCSAYILATMYADDIHKTELHYYETDSDTFNQIPIRDAEITRVVEIDEIDPDDDWYNPPEVIDVIVLITF